MEILLHYADIFMHLERYLEIFIRNYGFFAYFIIFFSIFAETGFVVTPFFPGDSLLIVVGVLASSGIISLETAFLLLIPAAILGNTSNYFIGRWLGPKIFHQEKIPILSREQLIKAHNFYEKYGAVTILVSRFLPIIRTLAPFAAGIGKMPFWKFSLFNIMGCLLWIFAFIFTGYFFGKIPWVRDNSFIGIVGALFLSAFILPFLVRVIQKQIAHHRK